MQAVPKFKNSDPGTDYARLWYFVMNEMGLAKIYRHTKFEVSNFTPSKDTAHMS